MAASLLGQGLPRFFILCILSGCRSLYSFPPAAERSISDDGKARHGSMGIEESHEKSFYCHVILAE